MSKKTFAALASLGSLVVTSVALAAVNVEVNPPQQGINPGTSVSTVLSNILTIIYVAAALAVLVMLIIGGFQWITSGGDKEKVGAARKRITEALIGLVVLALAYFIVVVVGQLVHIDIFNLKQLPSLDQCKAGGVFNTTTGDCEPAPPKPRTTTPTPTPTRAPGG